MTHEALSVAPRPGGFGQEIMGQERRRYRTIFEDYANLTPVVSLIALVNLSTIEIQATRLQNTGFTGTSESLHFGWFRYHFGGIETGVQFFLRENSSYHESGTVGLAFGGSKKALYFVMWSSGRWRRLFNAQQLNLHKGVVYAAHGSSRFAQSMPENLSRDFVR